MALRAGAIQQAAVIQLRILQEPVYLNRLAFQAEQAKPLLKAVQAVCLKASVRVQVLPIVPVGIKALQILMVKAQVLRSLREQL